MESENLVIGNTSEIYICQVKTSRENKSETKAFFIKRGAFESTKQEQL